MVTDDDIRDVANKAELTHADLHHLYGELKLLHSEIEQQERIADTKDFMLQAERVLTFWRQKNGKEATRDKLMTALQECKLNRAKEILEERWKLLLKVNMRDL